MNVLLIEDEDTKKTPILSFLGKNYPQMVVRTARSVKSGICALQSEVPDLLLLDMSLPTFDISAAEPGGRPQGSGGLEIMRHIDMLEIHTSVIVVTAYEAFSRKDGRRVDLTVLSKELKEDFPDIYRGIIHFNPMLGDWTQELDVLIQEVFHKEAK
jgi:CheY-like chemotaxis protein